VGAVAGSTTLAAAAVLAEPRLHLAERLDGTALGVGLWGAGVGAAHGLLASRVVEPDTSRPLADRQTQGALLLGASAGLGAGLVVGTWVRPTAVDYAGVTGASLLGHSLGLGIARLALADDGTADRREPTLRMAGALAGLGGGALVAHRTQLRIADLGAGGLGVAYGGLLGR
jgi:hypothetical protein